MRVDIFPEDIDTRYGLWRFFYADVDTVAGMGESIWPIENDGDVSAAFWVRVDRVLEEKGWLHPSSQEMIKKFIYKRQQRGPLNVRCPRASTHEAREAP